MQKNTEKSTDVRKVRESLIKQKYELAAYYMDKLPEGYVSSVENGVISITNQLGQYHSPKISNALIPARSSLTFFEYYEFGKLKNDGGPTRIAIEGIEYYAPVLGICTKKEFDDIKILAKLDYYPTLSIDAGHYIAKSYNEAGRPNGDILKFVYDQIGYYVPGYPFDVLKAKDIHQAKKGDYLPHLKELYAKFGSEVDKMDLPEDFIRKHIKELNIKNVLTYSDLSETFVRELLKNKPKELVDRIIATKFGNN